MPDFTVGQFSLKDSILSGPLEYMQDQGNALVDTILSGSDTVFNMTAAMSPTVEQAVLVRLQTDYAGWLGMQQVRAWCK